MSPQIIAGAHLAADVPEGLTRRRPGALEDYAADALHHHTVEARKFECGCPPTLKPGDEGTPAQIVPGPYSNFLESTVEFLQSSTSRLLESLVFLDLGGQPLVKKSL